MDNTIKTTTVYTYWLTMPTPRLESCLTTIAVPQFSFNYNQNELRQQFYDFKEIPRSHSQAISFYISKSIKTIVFWKLPQSQKIHSSPCPNILATCFNHQRGSHSTQCIKIGDAVGNFNHKMKSKAEASGKWFSLLRWQRGWSIRKVVFTPRHTTNDILG